MSHTYWIELTYENGEKERLTFPTLNESYRELCEIKDHPKRKNGLYPKLKIIDIQTGRL